MPVNVRKLPGKKRWRVWNDGKITAYSTTRKKALAQARLLRSLG